MKSYFARSAWLVVCLLVACPVADDDGDPCPGDLNLAVTAANYCELSVDFFCDFYMRCGRMHVTDVCACRGVFLETCNAKYEPVYAALADAAMMELSASGLSACSSHLSQVACSDQSRDLEGPCAEMWVGLQPLGDPCGLGIESLVCEPGTACSIDMSFCGTCKKMAGVGETCGGDVVCGSAASCSNGLCQARSGLNFVAVGDACDFDNRCPYKSNCTGGRCESQAMLGETCDSALRAPCASGHCDDAITACVSLLDPGAACAASSQCVSGLCANGTCELIPGRCFSP